MILTVVCCILCWHLSKSIRMWPKGINMHMIFRWLRPQKTVHCSIWTSWMSSLQHRSRWIESLFFKEYWFHNEGVNFTVWMACFKKLSYWILTKGLGIWNPCFVLVIFLFWVLHPWESSGSPEEYALKLTFVYSYLV